MEKTSFDTILQAAIRLLRTEPFHKVSVRAIAKEAGVSPSLIYKYFTDQQELFIQAFSAESKLLIQYVKQHAVSLESATVAYLHYMYEHDSLYQIMANFMLSPQKNEAALPFVAPFIEDLFTIFESTTPVIRRIDSQLIFSTLNGALITYKDHPALDDLAHMEKVVQHLIIHFSPKVHAQY